MITTISIGNNLELFYSTLSNAASRMFPNLFLNVNIISNDIYYISLKDVSDRLVMDMYALNLLPESNDVTLKQITICNNLVIGANNEIDFTTFTMSNIGPCIYSYDNNNNRTQNTYWINNTSASSLNINTGDSNIDTLYKQIYQFSFNSILLPTDDYNEIKYLWLGFKSYQDTVPLFYVTLTDKDNFGVFGITDAIPNIVHSYFKAITTQSNTPIVYDLNNLSMSSTVICLSNIFIPESINHEYLPYLYYCVGKDNSASNYIQLEANGVEYIKGLNNLIAVTSNPKFTLYQKISYTLNIFNTNYYEINNIKLINNTDEVIVDWGDGTPNTTINAHTTSTTLSHAYTPNGIYTLTIYYLSLTNPNLISNVATTDKYTTKVDFSKAYQLTQLNVANIFKSTDVNFANKLVEVILPPNLTSMNVDGFCENRTNLSKITLPTTNCTLTGQWLYNSALEKGNVASFTYPANLTFTKNTNNVTNDFYTGNFSENVIINSDVECDTLFVGDSVTTLTLNGDIDCSVITGKRDYLDNVNAELTTLTIAEDCDISATIIHDLPDLTTLSIGGNTNIVCNLNNLNSLSTLTLSNDITSIYSITYCNSLSTLNISQYVTYINSTVGSYCNSFNAFNVSADNSNYSSANGVLYNKTYTTLVRIPYGYVNTASYELPNTVTTIGAYSMFTKNTLNLISMGSNVISIDNDFLGDGHIGTLYINSDILSNSVFSSGTIDNLILMDAVTTLNTNVFSDVSISSLTIYDENMILNTNMFNMDDLVLIKGYANSTAETFANTNHITFIPLSFGTNTTVYDITIPTNNYTLSNVCSLSQSYSQIEWGDGSEPQVIYNFDDTITHTYETAGNYTVTITHIAPASIDFSYTNVSQGLFSVATELDFSGLTLCSNTVTNIFNNLSNVTEIKYPPNIISITNTLNQTNNVTSVTLPASLTTLLNSFNNQNYNSLSTLVLPTGLTVITNCFNSSNAIKGTTLTLDSTNTISGLTITDSFNSGSATITTLTFGENVCSVVNSFMNLLGVTTLTVNASNTHLSATNNVLCNYAGTELILVPGGLSTFTIPNTVTTLLQGSIANIKTYSEIVIPVNVTTINFPFYNSLYEQGYTTITNLRALNPYTSMADINKIVTITEGGTTTYIDTANVTGITGYEHSIIHSQITGYNRYPNCSAYTFTSLGYYNSSIVLGSNYTNTLFTNAQLVSISNNLIDKFNENYNYIVPDKTVYSHLSELTTYLTTNTFDYTSYPYVIFYYIDTINNVYNYILYVLDSTYTGLSITIDSADTYNCRKITVDYNVTNITYTNLTDGGSFTTQAIITSAVDTYSVLTFNEITAILKSDNTNITPTFLKYTTLIQENPNISNAFIGYVFGSNDTGTNKLFLSDPVIRIDDYWINVNTTLIDADNIVHINAYNINYNGNFITTTISGSLPLIFNGIGNDLINYTIYGTENGAGVETGNIVFSTIPAANIDATGRILSRNASYLAIAPIEQSKSYSFMTEDVVLFAFYDSLPQMGSIAYDALRHGASETGGVPTFIAPITGYVAYRNINKAPAMLVEGNVVPTTFIPYGYKIPLTVTSGVTSNIFDPDATDTTNGYIKNRRIIGSDGTTLNNENGNVTEYIPVKSQTAYSCIGFGGMNSNDGVCFYDSNKTFISGYTIGYATTSRINFSTPVNCAFIRACYRNSNINKAMLTLSNEYPDHYIPHRYTADYNLYIGSTKLGAEEYVDFEEQKVYKRTEQLFNKDSASDFGYYLNENGTVTAERITKSSWVSAYISVKEGENYFLTKTGSSRGKFYKDDFTPYQTTSFDFSALSSGVAFNVPTTVKYVRFTINVSQGLNNIMLTEDTDPPETYLPYLQPTDPPVPFPAITAYNNENTLTSTEIVGNTILEVSEPIPELTEIEEDVTTLKLLKTDKYMFENNVELVSPIYELPTT